MSTVVEQEHVIDLRIDVPLREVLRMMGCGTSGTPSKGVVATAERLLAEALPHIHPRGIYRVCQISAMSETRLDLTGWPSIHGPVAGYLRPSRRMVVNVITIGNATQEMGDEKIKSGNVFEGYCMHAIGAAAADMAADAMAEHIREHEAGPDEDITPPFSPGYCGLGLDQQQAIFSIVDASRIGVKLWPSFLMEPVKSVSGIIGIGPAEEITDYGVPCQWCELTTCKMRR